MSPKFLRPQLFRAQETSCAALDFSDRNYKHKSTATPRSLSVPAATTTDGPHRRGSSTPSTTSPDTKTKGRALQRTTSSKQRCTVVSSTAGPLTAITGGEPANRFVLCCCMLPEVSYRFYQALITALCNNNNNNTTGVYRTTLDPRLRRRPCQLRKSGAPIPETRLLTIASLVGLSPRPAAETKDTTGTKRPPWNTQLLNNPGGK